jgi:hypothetical protein
MVVLMLLNRMKRDDLAAHGFRSRFRDGAAERTKLVIAEDRGLAHAAVAM